jgi:hypothetical protein
MSHVPFLARKQFVDVEEMILVQLVSAEPSLVEDCETKSMDCHDGSPDSYLRTDQHILAVVSRDQ